MKRGLLFYNPKSGGQSISNRIGTVIELSQKNNVLLQPYRLDHNANKRIPQLLKSGTWDFVIASGGDGTLNSIVNHLLKHAPSTSLGIIPSGTCNDFARCLELPNTLEKSLQVIFKGKTTLVDVGLIDNKSYFLSSFSGGMLVDVSFKTDPELKKNFGPLAYYLKALTQAVNIRSFQLQIQTEKAFLKETIILFVILNGKHAGGLSNIDHEAELSDGLMNIVLVKNCNRIDLANVFFKVLGKKPLEDPNIIKIKARQCKIECRPKINVSVDGEQFLKQPDSIEFLNKKLSVFTPK